MNNRVKTMRLLFLLFIFIMPLLISIKVISLSNEEIISSSLLNVIDISICFISFCLHFQVPPSRQVQKNAVSIVTIVTAQHYFCALPREKFFPAWGNNFPCLGNTFRLLWEYFSLHKRY